MDRRAFLGYGLGALGLAAIARPVWNLVDDDPPTRGPDRTGRTDPDNQDIDPLLAPDENGLRLRPGFRSRVIATTGAVVAGTDYPWHRAPDGGACFPLDGGGWAYVSNSEVGDKGGGVGVIHFAPDGSIAGAGAILTGSSRNCAGGPTPWGTWLSCEEHDAGIVWECDPRRQTQAVPRPALGTFQHEAAAVDLANSCVYLTEDEPDGRFYRFTAAGRAGDRLDLTSGRLEVAEVQGDGAAQRTGPVVWHPVPDPNPADKARATRRQVPQSTAFDGGEGAWFHNGHVYWAAKGDDRLYDYDTAAGTLRVLYDQETAENPILKGLDNVTVTPTGDVLVAEDGDNMQLCVVVVDPSRGPAVAPLLEIVGHDESEVTGPAFSPDGTRLYFSSQRGPAGGGERGVTYEVTGPFR